MHLQPMNPVMLSYPTNHILSTATKSRENGT